MSPPGAARRVAYLTNLYPSPSHSFIRREILALETAGWEVYRFAHRHNPIAPVDPDDINELGLTCVLLEFPYLDLVRAALGWLLERPRDTSMALAMAIRMAWNGNRRFTAHLAYFMMACLLSRRLRRLECHHVHAHFGTNPAAVVCIAHRLCGLRYSVTFHGPHEFDPSQRLSLRDKIEGAAFVAAVSCGGHRRLVEQFPTLAHKFRLIRCGLDAGWFEPSRHGLRSTGDLVWVARLEPQKDPMLLLDAARILVESGLDFRLVVAGDGSLRGKMEARIAAEGLGRHLLLVGWQTQREVAARLRTARALVLSSRDEGLPVVIMEAFALGVPAIAPDVGGVSELVESGASGWLVPRGDPKALAEAMRACLAAVPNELERLGSEARRRAMAHDIRASVDLLAQGFRGRRVTGAMK